MPWLNVESLYENRFGGSKLKGRKALWQVLCQNFFQNYIPKDSAVLDIGAGYCEFINNIDCAQKYAIDLNKNTVQFADPNVKVFICPSEDMSPISDESIDIVFMSNFLEHLESRKQILQTLEEALRVLKPAGSILILMPNIRYLYKEYWDFLDHRIPLSDKSVIEALLITGFKIKQSISKFLPYTTKSKFPQLPFLVRLYLKMPLAWKIFGKQAFIVARKNG
jgi:ubiquinone/menaquinone biosynthesis C-methylase UbiE